MAQLKIIIVGGGIAGFSAAISLRRAGHDVQIYERSAMNNELGAAIHVAPNASRGLLAWGLDPARSRLVTCKNSFRAKGPTLEKFHVTDESYIEPSFGAPWFLCHRVDLHEELKLLATQVEGSGKPATVHLRSEVASYDYVAGSITLRDGTKVSGDLIIAADGVHSVAVEAILGAPNPALPTTNYNFAYRFIIPTQEIASDPETVQFTEDDDGRMKFYVADGQRLVWYPCRNNEEHNFVAIFHNDDLGDREDWQQTVDKSALLQQYKDFHPSILAVMKKATKVMQWPLLFRAPIPIWHKEKLVLIGDAAHPMLPHQGQGGGQAIEDAVSLGIALTNVTPNLLSERLQVWENVRKDRGSVMQIFSNAGQDEPEKIRKDAAKIIPEDRVPKTPEEFFKYNFGYDVVEDTKQQIKKQHPKWELPADFFEKAPGRGTYP